MSSNRTPRRSTQQRKVYREETLSADERAVSPDETEDEYELNGPASEEEDDNLIADELEEAEVSGWEDEDEVPTPTKKRKSGHVTKVVTPKRVKTSAEGWDEGVTRIVMKLVSAPQTGHVPAGQISPHLIEFLRQLQANNDRDWFKMQEPVYKYCLKNFNDFVEVFLNDLMEVDPTVPWLPPKDLVYRIYRDVRFSNDKTPYKTNFMASISRGGRKGQFAGYHVLIKPGGRSFFGAGRWQAESADLAEIRRHILQRTPEAIELKAAISAPSFVKWYGPAKRDSKGRRSNLFGGDDELKIAPKIAGVDKNHPDIDLLRLRSFCGIHNFSDAQVLEPNFRAKLAEVATASEPLVRILNSMTSPDPPPPTDSEQGEEEGTAEEEEEEVDEPLEYDDGDEE